MEPIKIEELESLAKKVKDGSTTRVEDLQIVAGLNASLEMTKFFLNEIKVAKIKQDINNQ